ncbi:MAG: hypothetical protein IJ708_09320, partial [Clostridia bacterium]|nr:hypothetical protein [Clostridia bacterium]
MRVTDYLSSIYDSDDLHDYKYGKINPEPQDMTEPDKDVLLLILDIIRLNEQYKEKEHIFKQLHSERLPDINSVTKDDLSPLLSIDLLSLPLPICARLADFLWETVKDRDFGRIAIRSYLKLYNSLWNEEHWPNCIDAIHRAVNIACGLGKNGQEYKECIKAAKEGLNRTKGNDRLYLSSSLLEILCEQKCNADPEILQYARNAIDVAKKDQNLSKVQTVLEVLAKIDPLNRSSYYEEVGDITQAMAIEPAIRRVQILKQALQYYEKAGAKEKKKLCRKQLEEAQSRIVDEMQVIQTDPINISSTVEEVRASIRKTNSVKQAIIIFGDLVHISNKEELLKHVCNRGILANMFSSTRIDNRGRQIYSLPPLPLNEHINSDDDRVQLYMWDMARSLQELYADIVLKYALSELNAQYQYDESDLDFLVNKNAVIPEGREDIIRKGIYFGLKGDLYLALHVLMPQMENIIRYIVELCDGKTFYIKPDGNVDNVLLGSLLDSPEINDCYDADILFCLKGLMD